ncbi:ketopantoate reductase family protein [Subtercola endophyticus]|uniref:ketopantoate reductase family protein n=1 Tax=Subtercola endophyticus TaxID=2895559 RepID=UPI001E4BC697|nr:ketopantoate reductase family protein [Subtercola endophyticus]UFS58519.1 ketopantoate reductase family protein [Subtercola endophyticus]
MRILIVGAGAVGGFFGAKLVDAGRDVTFLVRESRAQQLARDGLRIRPFEGDESTLEVRTITASQLAGGPAEGAGRDSFDVILLSVKAYALEQALDDIAPAVSDSTVILPVLNGMRHLDMLRDRFGAARVCGGLCLVATQLDSDGAVRQVGPGASLSYGEFDGSRSDRMLAVDAAFADAGFRATLSSTIEHDMWEKWMLLAAGGALTTLLRGTVGEIVAAPGGVAAATSIVEETFAVASAAGFAPREAARRRTLATLTEAGSSFATSMFRDLRQGRDVEADQIVGDLVARGQARGAAVPILELAYAGLVVYRESRHVG